MTRPCNFCKKPFRTFKSQVKANKGKYCSKSCAMKARTGNRHPRWKGGEALFVCLYCKKSFKSKACYKINPNKGKYCSRSCSGKANPHPERLKHYSGEQHPSWRGGRIKDKYGYILVTSKNHPLKDSKGYVREHRLVIEKFLGRHLNKKEVVHHINGVKDDNRLENLQLMTDSDHKSVHMRKRYAASKQKRTGPKRNRKS